MTVYLVGGGPGDPGLVTVRGAELLRTAEVVLYDRLSSAALLDLAPPEAERISVGKTPRGPSTDQAEINRMLVEFGRAGRRVVRLKGGDPFVFARGGEEVAALAAAGVAFEVVPGVSAAIAAPAYAGVPVTYRGMSTSFTVVTGHEDPWADTETDWEAVARVGGTIVVLMGVATRADIAAQLIAGGMRADTPVAAVWWATRPDQRSLRTTLGGLGDAPVGATATIVIGEVARLDLGWVEQRPLFGHRVVVCRARHQAGTLSRRLVDLGADVVDAPVIEIADASDGGVALRRAASSVASYQWVAFTSANAVDRFCAHLGDARAFGSTTKIAAIGPGTAAALAHFGVVADLLPARSIADGLVDAIPPGPGRVLLPQAAGARPALAVGLLANGWVVDTVEAYRSVAVPLDDAGRTAVTGADVVALTSASTATNLVAALDGVAAPAAVCIGPETAAAAIDAGLKVVAVADPHTLDGLVAAVVATCAGTTGAAPSSEAT